ncbi:hypothetical protein CLF_109038 [Clonorchis sinensis]|uniref:Uncharacterized protein n=1 Tax=Clonorchis sinensis TaxID=79923 RepID=G7YIV2_CLOSI|nr:hypothetical protein CLF_109038 [Clonorchis sinensis]
MLTQANLRRKKAGTISTGQLGDHVRTNTIIVVNSMVGYQASFRFTPLATFLTRKPHESLLCTGWNWRQRWAESKLLEEEVARRLERYLDSELAKLLVERKDEFTNEVERRVEAERAQVLQARAAEAERRAREEAEATKRREEEERQKRYEAELRELEERQKMELEEQKRIKREQEIILNKKRTRPKLSFTLKK